MNFQSQNSFNSEYDRHDKKVAASGYDRKPEPARQEQQKPVDVFCQQSFNSHFNNLGMYR